MKRSEVFENVILDFIIFLFVLKLKSSDAYRRIFQSFSWDSFSKLDLKVRVKIATQKVMECCFQFKTTAAHKIYRSTKIMPKFMFIQGAKM